MTGNRVWLTGFALALALTSGCAGSVCDRAEAVAKSIADKGKACRGEGGVTEPREFDRAQCEAGVGDCSPEDLALVALVMECAEGAQACSASEGPAWLTSLLSCARDYERISPSCLHATLSQ